MHAKLAAEIEAILAEGQDMTVATLLADGAPHATTVSYASAGQTIYFGCSPTSRKAENLARDDRVALTITLPYRDWSEIRGLSVLGRARRIATGTAADAVALLFAQKFSEIAQYVSGAGEDIALFDVTPSAIVVLDYRRGFGHTTHTQPDAAPGFAPAGFVASPPVEAGDV